MSFQDSFWGPNGFEELRKSVKEGQDFTKDVASILHERCELEISYAKHLYKLSNKLSKATKFAIGTTQHAWQEVAVGMENEAEIHKRLAGSFEEDVIKPMKNLLDSQHKHRKCLESSVDKAAKILNERRNEEMKTKKLSYTCARENERMQDQALDSKVSKGKLLTEKDIHKLENKRRKAEETLARADVDYYNSCIKAERSRQDHESVVYRASTAFQQLEEERLSHMHDFLQKYANHLSLLGPSLTQGCERLNVAIASVDVTSDLQSMVEMKGTGPNIPEQILPDFYAENMSNEMKKERRKETLERFLTILKHDLELERRGKQGVENLAKVFQETPTFGDAEAQQDVFEKLQHVSAMVKRRAKKFFLTGVVMDHRSCDSQRRPIHKMRAMLTYLEASRYKLQCAVAELEGSPKPTHPLSAHMEIKSKQGVCQTVLKVPRWVRMERRNSESSGSAGSDVPDFELHQEGSLETDNRDQVYANLPTRLNSVKSSAQCQALYGYEAKLGDELSFNPGDIISIHEKTEDGWWHGELNGITGLFPSTYVQEI